MESELLAQGDLFGSLIKLSRKKSITLSKSKQVKISNKRECKLFNLVEIESISVDHYAFWSTVCINGVSDSLSVHGIKRSRSLMVRSELEKAIITELDIIGNDQGKGIAKLLTDIDCLLDGDFYVRRSHINKLQVRAKSIISYNNKEVQPLFSNQYFKRTLCYPTIKNDLQRLKNILFDNGDLINKRNTRFMNDEISRYDDFLNNVESNQLTLEQKLSVVAFEDRNLLVAAAGSGKSSTLISKVGYAIKRDLYEPGEIIALAFNRDAATELNRLFVE